MLLRCSRIEVHEFVVDEFGIQVIKQPMHFTWRRLPFILIRLIKLGVVEVATRPWVLGLSDARSRSLAEPAREAQCRDVPTLQKANPH